MDLYRKGSHRDKGERQISVPVSSHRIHHDSDGKSVIFEACEVDDFYSKKFDNWYEDDKIIQHDYKVILPIDELVKLIQVVAEESPKDPAIQEAFSQSVGSLAKLLDSCINGQQ